MSCSTLPVAPFQIRTVWPTVRTWLRPLIEEQGDETEESVLERLVRGHYALFYVPGKFAYILEVQQFPRQRVGVVLYLAGRDLAAIHAHATTIGIPWLRSMGCTKLRTYGRPGWAKIMGLAKIGVVLQSDI